MSRTFRHMPYWALKYAERRQDYYFLPVPGDESQDRFTRRAFKFRQGQRPLLNDGRFSYSSEGRMIEKRNERRWKRYRNKTLIRVGRWDDAPLFFGNEWLD